MRIRKAILTGGGRATRLYPITTTTNKHLLPLANKPMIFHAIEKVVRAGVQEIFINTNPGDTELPRAVGDGSRWGIRITFFEQTGGPLGIAHVVHEARRFIGDDPFLFYLSDNILLGGVEEMVEEFGKGGHDCLLALSHVPDPERFGIPLFDEQGRIARVIEKPEKPANNLAVIGIYIYGPRLFFEAFSGLQKSARGEYEISDVHSRLIERGYRVGHREMSGYWKDTGKPADLLIANTLLLEEMPHAALSSDVQIPASSTCSGMVHIDSGADIGDHVRIVGPAIIAAGARLKECTIGPNVTLGKDVAVTRAHIRDSIVLDGACIDTNALIHDSLVGKMALIRQTTTLATSPHRIIIGDKTVIEF